MSEATVLQSVTAKAPPSNFHSLLVQRKCACGAPSGLTGSCSDCEKKKLLGKPLQTKLRVNEPGDAYEQEADRVAEQVMRMEDPNTRSDAAKTAAAPLVQRKVSGSNAGLVTAPSIVHDVLASPGQPLDVATRAFFEPRFGHDFSRVRMHSGTLAMESAKAVNALAYTVGNDIVFGAKPYVRGTVSENPLLAHELTHVVQQGGHRSDEARIQRSGEVGGGSAGEILPACDQPSGIDTIIFEPHLATDARAVQLHYRKEEPPGGTARIFPADLSNLFPSHPLLAIVLEQSCGGWIRFDVTDLPAGWQGPSLEGDSITLWGLAPPPSPGTTASEISQEPKEPGLVFVADEFLFDFIVRRRQSTGKDEEAFDLRVIDEFFAGIGEGLGKDFSDQWNTLMQTYAQHALFFPFLQYRLWLGALDGIAEQGADALVFVTKFAEDPQAFRDQMMKAIRRGILQPRSTSRKFGIAIGEDFKQQIGTLIAPKNRENPGEFLYQLGKMVGPVLLEIVLAFLAPEAIALRGVTRVGGKLLGFVDEFFDLGKVGTIHWKPLSAETPDVDLPDVPTGPGVRKNLPDLTVEEQRLLQTTGDWDGKLPKHLADQELDIVRRAKKTPIQDTGDGYIYEVDLGNGHRWKGKGKEDGTWCRFSNEGENCTNLGEEDLEEAKIVGRIFPAYALKDWGKYIYQGRKLGIVQTPEGPQAWYVRTGSGGEARGADPVAGEPARVHGFAQLQQINEFNKTPIPEKTQKWFMKPQAGGRMGEGNENVFQWLITQKLFEDLPTPTTSITVLSRPKDVADLQILNNWLRENGIEPGKGYAVGEEIVLSGEHFLIEEIP